jgi:twitching motility protein PilT
VDLRTTLELMMSRRASDLHLRVGMPPVLRIDSQLVPLELPPLTKEDLEGLAAQVMPPEQIETFARTHEADFGFGVAGVARFRANFYLQRGTMAGALRAIPLGIPRIEDLNLPAAVAELVAKPRGLILVTGTVGSGKSTTLAAMIHHINRTTGKNIITIEDPIEFLHWNIKSIISQREVGQDTESYLAALRCILRQDPDVILIGEIRDKETMSVALMAADTGHLVLSTLHTTDAAQTVNRIISFYAPHQHEEVRYLLAGSLQAVVSMRLIPRADGQGRVPAVEVLINTETVRECLRDPGRTPHIRDVIADGVSQYGMQTFDQSLMSLYRRGLITLDEALKHATTPTEFELRLKGIVPTSDQTWEALDPGNGEAVPSAPGLAPAWQTGATRGPAPGRDEPPAPQPPNAKEDRRGGRTPATFFPELGPRGRRAASDHRKKGT